MRVTPLGPSTQAEALAYLRRWPYRNALPLSNVTQLRARCTALVAEDVGRVVGVASSYHDLPAPNLTFAVDDGRTLAALLERLAREVPALAAGPFMTLLPAERHALLRRHACELDAEPEQQLAVEPETLRPLAGPAARRLTPHDIPALNELASAAGLSLWSEGALALGPAFGCEAGGRLVAMAATRFATPDVIELGHVATHPDHRGRGYARACTSALAQAALRLAPRVFLMALDSNTAARAVYRSLGFHAVETFYLARFTLS